MAAARRRSPGGRAGLCFGNTTRQTSFGMQEGLSERPLRTWAQPPSGPSAAGPQTGGRRSLKQLTVAGQVGLWCVTAYCTPRYLTTISHEERSRHQSVLQWTSVGA